MKNKIFLLLSIMFLFIPIKALAKENVFIESAKIHENNEVEEIDNVSFQELNLNTNLRFSKVNSYIIYEISIKNNDNKDYLLDNNLQNDKNEYITYNYNCNTNNIIKAKSNTTCLVTIKYETPAFIGDIFESTIKENQVFKLNLINEITNPSTHNNLKIILIILTIIGIGFIIVKNKKTKLLILMITLCIPFITKAITKITININNKVEIVGNSYQCSHKAKTLKEHIMCIFETDFNSIGEKLNDAFKITKEKEYDKEKTILSDLENGTRTYDDVNYDSLSIDEVREYVENFDSYYNQEYLELNEIANRLNDFSEVYNSDTLDWDDRFNKAPNKDTYKNYPEGVYVDEMRFIPIIREINEDNLKGYSFRKMDLSEGKDIVSEVTNINDVIKYEIQNEDLKIIVNGKLYLNKQENDSDSILVDGYMEIVLSKDENSNVYIKDWYINPESLSQTMYRRKLGLVNDLIDVYINMARNRIIYGDKYYISGYETENLLVQLSSRYHSLMYIATDIRKRNIELYEDEKLDFRANEFLRNTRIDFNGFKIRNEFYNTHDYNNYTQEEKNNMLKEFYNYYGVEPIICTQEISYKNGCEIGEYTYYPEKLDLSRYNVVYNNKFYEKEDGFFRFIADYLNINTNNSNDIKKTIYNSLIE